jgi:hypothetical protein
MLQGPGGNNGIKLRNSLKKASVTILEGDNPANFNYVSVLYLVLIQ